MASWVKSTKSPVNNAALTYFLPVKDYPLNRWMRSWAVNFHAPFVLSKLALGEMIPRGSGSIVNISSVAAIGPGRGPYGEPPDDVGGTVDPVSHHLLGFRVEAVEYVTKNIWLVPAVKPYHDLLAAACKRQSIEMVVTEADA